MKHPTHEALRRLRLYGMARGLEDLERPPERSQLSFDDQLALLVERETAERAHTALASRLKRARLRHCLEDLDCRAASTARWSATWRVAAGCASISRCW
ncbi:MAG TPA: ATP-binding protein [Sphingomicrobium sp.]|nr:ATP-binding protein [Sphingomicrobium sp.]